PSPQGPGPQKSPGGGGAPVGTGATTDPSSWNDAISAASHVSTSLNVVQRWNGQPASMQIRSSERFASTMSEYPAAYRSLSPSPMYITCRPAARCANTRSRLQ